MNLYSYISQGQYRYYFEQLDSKAKRTYETLLDGYLRQMEEIRVCVDNIDTLWNIHRGICYDIPEIFFIKKVQASIHPFLGSITVYPEYRFDEKTLVEMLTQMTNKTEMLLRRIQMLSELDKVRKIHDFLIRSVTYKDVDAPYSHEAPGILLYGIGCCEGISKAFKYIADRIGIKSIVAVGNTTEPDEDVGHAWNIVYVNGQPHHLDITFDYSMSKGVIRYDYFLLSDAQIEVDHTFIGLPSCDSSIEYYELFGDFAKNKHELQKLVSTKLRPGAPLVFKIPQLSSDKEEIVSVVMKVVTSSISFPYSLGRSISLTYNIDRMIFQVQLC